MGRGRPLRVPQPGSLRGHHLPPAPKGPTALCPGSSQAGSCGKQGHQGLRSETLRAHAGADDQRGPDLAEGAEPPTLPSHQHLGSPSSRQGP